MAPPPPNAPYPYPYPYPYTPYGYPYPPQYGYGPPPPAVKPPDPGRKLHDGFYLQMSPGIAYSHMRLGIQGQSTVASMNGGRSTFGLAVGATIAGGFSLAAEVGLSSGTLKLEADNAANAGSLGAGTTSNVSTSSTSTHLGLLADWYLNPHQGFHLQGGFGLASLDLSNVNVGPVQTGTNAYSTVTLNAQTGYSVAIGAGWEAFISDEWSVGALLRLDAAWGSDTNQGVATKASLVEPSLRISFTYNLVRYAPVSTARSSAALLSEEASDARISAWCGDGRRRDHGVRSPRRVGLRRHVLRQRSAHTGRPTTGYAGGRGSDGREHLVRRQRRRGRSARADSVHRKSGQIRLDRADAEGADGRSRLAALVRQRARRKCSDLRRYGDDRLVQFERSDDRVAGQFFLRWRERFERGR